jgi:putative spermidine/putrescine transport system substrate-binding protein
MTVDSKDKGVTRRSAIKRIAKGSALAAASIGAPMIWTQSRAAQTLVVADPGGPYPKAFGEAFYKPFQEATGIEIVPVARKGNPSSQVKALVETKNYSWDVVMVSWDIQALLRNEGLLDKIDMTGPDMAEIPADRKSEYGLTTGVYCFVNAWRTDKYGDKGPQSFADIWDTKRFPGRRALRKNARDAIEIALRADGVKGGPDIYKVLSTKEGWDRAFKKLDQIKPHVAVWWQDSAQSTQVLKTGEVDICPALNARVQAAIDGGAPVRIEWAEGFYGFDSWVLPKGGPKVDMARQFVKFCANAKRQAAYTPNLSYGPTNPNAYKFIPAARAALLPTSPQNFPKIAYCDDEFWGKHKDQSTERFEEWLLR